MYHAIGKLVARTWPCCLGAWIVLFVGLVLAAPPWEQVTEDAPAALLPRDAPSNRAQARLREAFPETPAGSTVVIVLSREDSPLNDADRAFIESDLESALEALAFPETDPAAADAVKPTSLITRIQSLNTKGAGPLLVSADQRATLVTIDLAAEFQSRDAWPTIAAIEEVLDKLRHAGKVPPGLELTLTGSAVVARDVNALERTSVAAIERWTLIVVILLLLFTYRAPVLALLPLLTVYVSVQIGVKLLSILAANHVLNITEGLRIYITVVAYGAGVDYCLFLMARYREEWDSGSGVRESMASALGKVGETLTASAATVMGGIGMLAFAEFGKYHQAGLTIPLAVGVTLASTLTLSAPLLILAGRWAYWPRREWAKRFGKPGDATRRARTTSWIWRILARALLRRPGTIWLTSVALMLPFAALALINYGRWDYGVVRSLPADTSSVRGTQRIQKHFSVGVIGPVTVLVDGPDVDFRTHEGRDAVSKLTKALQARREQLQIADVRSLAMPAGITAAAEASLAQVEALNPSAANAVRERTTRYYVSSDGSAEGRVARLDINLAVDPLSHAGIEALGRIEKALRAAVPAGTDILMLGATSSLRDLQEVTSRDLLRIQVLVPAVVLVILVVVLRRVVVSLYLIVSVLFSYLVTLGLTWAVFWALDPAGFGGLDWKVPILLFTILVAVGEDYNIFLMTRVDEESSRRGPIRGILAALVKTGRIISTCGFIMAGTLASLLSGSLGELKQLGFALAAGVLLDTLVIRSILVPAALVLVQRKRRKGLSTAGRAVSVVSATHDAPAAEGQQCLPKVKE